jgi:hypothetical protein
VGEMGKGYALGKIIFTGQKLAWSFSRKETMFPKSNG